MIKDRTYSCIRCKYRVVAALKHLHAETAAELDALLPAILDKAFKREL